MYKFAICLLTIFALINTFAFQNDSLENKLNGKKFKVTDYSTKELTDLRKHEAPNKFHILQFDGKKLTVTGLCRTVIVTFKKLENNSVKFQGFVSTGSDCGKLDKLEDDLTNVLINARKITLDGRNLIITDSNKSIKASQI